MIEKTGHKGRMRMARMEWIEEGKPKSSVEDEDNADISDPVEERAPAKFPSRIAPIFQSQTRATDRPSTPPAADDLFGDVEEDIYGATPRASKAAPAQGGSIFGNGLSTQTNGEPDEDDLEALMAEEEAQRPASFSTSIFGNGTPTKRPAVRQEEPDEDDLDAMMAEVEADSRPKGIPAMKGKKSGGPFLDNEDDDLDALIAETEAQGSEASNKARDAPTQDMKPAADRDADADEEEAMAEMDGLW